MANPGQGHKSYVQIGSESPSAWGTAVAATRKLEIISEGVIHDTQEIDDPSLHDARSRRETIDGPQLAQGPMRFQVGYEGFEQIYRGILGAYVDGTNGAGVVTHAFTEGDQRGLTNEIVKGDVTTGKAFRLVGGKIRSFTFDCPANGAATLDIDYLGKDLEPDFTPTAALSFPAWFPVLGKQAVATVDGTADATADVRVRNLKITYTAPQTEDRFYMGGANMDEPLPADFVSTVWEIQQEFKTLSAYNAARNRTVGSLDFLYRHPTIISGAARRQLRFRSTTAKCKLSAPTEGYGVLLATATWKAYYNATDAGSLKIDVQNTIAALGA